MTDDRPQAELPDAGAAAGSGSGVLAARVPRRHREPAATLTSAMVVYIFINLLFGLPLFVFPEAFFDAIGLQESVADDLGGLRWVGAVILAWAISGILVLARPEGRAIFVTTGALQLTLGAFGLLYSWSVGEHDWSTWYQAVASAVLTGGALYLWWARFRGRAIFKGRPDRS
ncbi:MAG: hypothetical protein ACE5GC_03305 [Acidimicrobiia bacterium]